METVINEEIEMIEKMLSNRPRKRLELKMSSQVLINR